MLKKMMLMSAVATLCTGLSSVYAADPTPDPSPGVVDQGSGKVDFTGSVIDAPCSVDANDGKPVDLGSTSLQSLKDGVTNPKSFNINLKNCNIGDATKSKTVYITFTGSGAYEPTGNNPNILGVTGSAQNVGIILQNGSSGFVE